ncbi:MAG: hypothetical protein ACI4I1_03665 [Oscillospiraceae bacterium]
MLNRKFAAVIIAAVCLTSCANADSTPESTSETTSATTASTAETAETEILTEEEPAETETTAKKLSAEEYFSTLGYNYDSYHITIDMNDFAGAKVPFSDVDEKYIGYVNYLTITNVDNADLGFVKDLKLYDLTFDKYNGKTDLSFLADSTIRRLTFNEVTDSTGLEAVSNADSISSITIESYSGNIDFGFTANCDNLHTLSFGSVTDSNGLETIAKAPNITYIIFDKYDQNVDLGFLSECPKVNTLRLTASDIKIDMFADAVENSSVITLCIETDNYDIAEGEKMIKALPDVYINYSKDDSDWFELLIVDEDFVPETDVIFYTNPSISAGTNDEKWECRTRELSYASPHPDWDHYNSLVCVFSNYSKETKTVDSARLYKVYDGTSPILFKNGKEELDIGFELAPRKKTDLEITHEMLDYADLETGLYKIVFKVGNDVLEQQFTVGGDDSPSFLTEEQQQVYQKAYDITDGYFGCSVYMPESALETTTAEDFLSKICEGYTYDYAVATATRYGYLDENGNLKATAGDRGSDISYFDRFFLPVYSDENTVLFQNIITHAHEDNPYFIWFETLEYKMVKTENGWRFDNFPYWH